MIKSSSSVSSETEPANSEPILEDDCAKVLKEKFNCGFDSQGRLKNLDSGESLILPSQLEYNRLGDLVIRYVQEKLKTELEIREIWIPEDVQERCNIFISKDWETNSEKAMVLIQGAGDVRSGIWSRSICINDSLELGSMIPYAKQAVEENYSVIILNPNFNVDILSGKKIKHNENPILHSLYVWEKYVVNSPAKEITIVAHSCGGVCTIELLKNHWKFFKHKVKAIAFTDSVHSCGLSLRKKQRKYLMKTAVDWVTSAQPLDTKIKCPYPRDNGCTNVSAGHMKHEYTSGTAKNSIFCFFKEMLENNKNTYI